MTRSRARALFARHAAAFAVGVSFFAAATVTAEAQQTLPGSWPCPDWTCSGSIVDPSNTFQALIGLQNYVHVLYNADQNIRTVVNNHDARITDTYNRTADLYNQVGNLYTGVANAQNSANNAYNWAVAANNQAWTATNAATNAQTTANNAYTRTTDLYTQVGNVRTTVTTHTNQIADLYSRIPTGVTASNTQASCTTCTGAGSARFVGASGAAYTGSYVERARTAAGTAGLDLTAAPQH